MSMALLEGEQMVSKVCLVTRVYTFDGETWSRACKLELTSYRLRLIHSPIAASVVLEVIPRQERIEDVPLFALSRVHVDSLRMRLQCRDVREMTFDFASHHELQGLHRLIVGFAFPMDACRSSFAFKTRYRVGLGWDCYDALLDGSMTLRTDCQLALTTSSCCTTYPSNVWIPSTVIQDELQSSSEFRSLGRHPVAVWAHPINKSVLVRSAQPLVGLLGLNRNAADEKLVKELCGNRYLLLDARSKSAALGNRAIGKGGTESCDRGYEGAQVVHCDLGNIHTIKSSFHALCQSIVSGDYDDRYPMNVAGWLTHVSHLIRACVRATISLDRDGESVFTHCSDGWDRTSQMCALIQLMCEPHYRTRLGLACCIEKSFAYYGFKFRERGRGGNDHVKLNNESNNEQVPYSFSSQDDEQISPVFLLFLESTYQLLIQFPNHFEFNEFFLLALVDAHFSGRFGTFLCNSHKERMETRVMLETRSVWDYVCSEDEFINNNFTPLQATIIPSFRMRSMKLFEAFWLRYSPVE